MSLSLVDSLALKIRRGETPFYRHVKEAAAQCRSSALPTPGFVQPALRTLFSLHQSLWRLSGFLRSYLYNGPLFRARCESVGEQFRVCRMPWVTGHTRIQIGSHVNFFGKVDIVSGRLFDAPRLVIGDRVGVGHNVVFVVNKEIVIENDVLISSGVRLLDTDSHPKDAADRIANLPPRLEEVKPIRICRYAWIGHNSFILKGVTIGEGAIIGVNSVVVTDIPAYSVAMGNPARVVVKNASVPVVPHAA